MKIVDAQGEPCPKPLILTKKALADIPDNETLEVLIDNEISLKNVTRFLTDNGFSPVVRAEGKVFHLFVSKTGNIPQNTSVSEYCDVCTPSPKSSGYVISIQRDTFGDGAEELGKILLKAFVNTLPEAPSLPKTIIFINSGVFLTTKKSPVIDALTKLQQQGVNILVCGACVDYYGENDNIAVGEISNMYVIIEHLSSASNVIYP